TWTCYVAAALLLVSAVLAHFVVREDPSNSPDATDEVAVESPQDVGNATLSSVALVTLAATGGFVGIALEILLLRAILLFVPVSAHAFAGALAIFLLG